MNINWITKCKDWAYFHLCKHIASKLPDNNHVYDRPNNHGDVKFICSPNFFKHGYSGDPRTILHLDSNRWYEPINKD